MVKVYLPDKRGAYLETEVPCKIEEILGRVEPICDCIYRLSGGDDRVKEDLDILEMWVKKYHSDFWIEKTNICEGYCFGVFGMTDPVVNQLEKVGILKSLGGAVR